MPKVTIEISDSMKRGKPTCDFAVKLDTQGHPNEAPATLALLMAATIRELAMSGVLERLVPLIEAKEALRAYLENDALTTSPEPEVIDVDAAVNEL